MTNRFERQDDILKLVAQLDISATMYKNADEKYHALATFFKGDRVSFLEMMKIAREQQAMFVTPNDLANHITNATQIGMLKVERYGKDYDENWK